MKIKKWRNLSKGFARSSGQHVLNKSFVHIASNLSYNLFNMLEF